MCFKRCYLCCAKHCSNLILKVLGSRRESNKIKTHVNGIKDKANISNFKLFKMIKEKQRNEQLFKVNNKAGTSLNLNLKISLL